MGQSGGGFFAALGVTSQSRLMGRPLHPSKFQQAENVSSPTPGSTMSSGGTPAVRLSGEMAALPHNQLKLAL